MTTFPNINITQVHCYNFILIKCIKTFKIFNALIPSFGTTSGVTIYRKKRELTFTAHRYILNGSTFKTPTKFNN